MLKTPLVCREKIRNVWNRSCTDDYQMLDLACLNTIQFSLVVPVLLKVSDESDFIFGKQRKCKWSSRALVLKQLFKPSDFEKSKSLCYKDNGMEAPQ